MDITLPVIEMSAADVSDEFLTCTYLSIICNHYMSKDTKSRFPGLPDIADEVFAFHWRKW